MSRPMTATELKAREKKIWEDFAKKHPTPTICDECVEMIRKFIVPNTVRAIRLTLEYRLDGCPHSAKALLKVNDLQDS